MRRSLVLGDENARHPFLQSLPPHVRVGRVHPMRQAEPVSAPDALKAAINTAVHDAGREAQQAQKRWGHALWHRIKRQARQRPKITNEDVRGFLLAYCACFMAVSAFIW